MAELVAAASAAIVVLGIAAWRPSMQFGPLTSWAGASLVVLTFLGIVARPGLVLLAGAAVLATMFTPEPERQRWLLIGLGIAIAIAALTSGADTDLRFTSVLPALASGPLLWLCYQRFEQSVTTILWAGTALGIYINVPDTEQIVVQATGLIILSTAMVLVPTIRNSPVQFEALALIGVLVVCAGSWGSQGRPAAFIGVIGAFGVLVAEPLAALIRRGTNARPAILIAVHTAAVLVASRWAGVNGNGDEVAIVAGTFAVAVVLLTLLPRQSVS